MLVFVLSKSQINVFFTYFFQVHEKIGLSPGEFTRKVAILRDIQAAKRKAIRNTHASKKSRLKLKCER